MDCAMHFKCTQVFNVFFEPYHLFYWGTARVNYSFVFCSHLPAFFFRSESESNPDYLFILVLVDIVKTAYSLYSPKYLLAKNPDNMLIRFTYFIEFSTMFFQQYLKRLHRRSRKFQKCLTDIPARSVRSNSGKALTAHFIKI